MVSGQSGAKEHSQERPSKNARKYNQADDEGTQHLPPKFSRLEPLLSSYAALASLRTATTLLSGVDPATRLRGLAYLQRRQRAGNEMCHEPHVDNEWLCGESMPATLGTS
jgi:hypothetical protein